ncbi:MAG: glycine zipper family protein [Methylococcaceae bacterium]
MKKLATGIVFAGSILVSACASQTGWAPTIDSYNDPNAYRINQDMAECKVLAEQTAGGTAKEAAIGTGVGALIGAAGGAAIGAIAGSPGTGAAIGAAAGGIGGGSYKGIDTETKYKNAYNNCMSNRGHKVIR